MVSWCKVLEENSKSKEIFALRKMFRQLFKMVSWCKGNLFKMVLWCKILEENSKSKEIFALRKMFRQLDQKISDAQLRSIIINHGRS